MTDAPAFNRRLDALVALRGREVVAGWQHAAAAGRFGVVFLDLMHRHYDPGYERSMRTNFAGFDAAPVIALDDGGEASLAAAAEQLLAGETPTDGNGAQALPGAPP